MFNGGHPKSGRFNFRAFSKKDNLLFLNIGISHRENSIVLQETPNYLIVGLNDSDFIITQSIDLLDKNNIMIYEGDFVLYNDIIKGIVRYSENWGGFVFDPIEGIGVNLGQNNSEIPISKIGGLLSTDIKIVGNIFNEDYMKYLRYLAKS